MKIAAEKKLKFYTRKDQDRIIGMNDKHIFHWSFKVHVNIF